MIEIVLTIFLALAFCYYSWFLWTVKRGLRFAVQPRANQTPVVSIVVAARDEEANIQSCLNALAKQDYDVPRYEIIIVDDHSSDHTRSLVQGYAEKHADPEIKVISLDIQAGEHGKPAAISRGVEAARGEIILCTDADCVVPTRWVHSMAGCFDPAVAFVAGPVREREAGNLFMKLQSLEFLGLLTTAAGLIGSGTPIICNGANIAFRKSAFDKIQGYGRMKSSCDDETLMQRIITNRIGRVVFNADVQAMVATNTPGSFREFLNQRTRWAAKRGRYDDPFILLRLIGLYLFFLGLLLSAIASIMLPALRSAVVAILILKALAEFVVLNSGAQLLHSRLRLSYFLIAEVFHVPYIAIAAFIGQIKSIRWKGRILDQ
ncbi:MAG TPA: hypothetical protein DEP53_00995 [Bacteroidetes bacterium]|nr:hypothetical protein [Bacteroidota bacterium]